MVATIAAAVEGLTDEAVARKLIAHVGANVGQIYGGKGKSHLRKRISGYSNAARYTPWLVLVDLDHDADCTPPFVADWLQNPPKLLCFRVAVRAVEAWLLADVEMISAFLRVARARIPHDPQSLDDPKAALVELARASRRAEIRQDMVPRDGSGRKVGPAYTSRLIEYVNEKWRPAEAARRVESLQRAIRCLRRLTVSFDGA